MRVLPMAVPPPRRTLHGAPMSPRLARLYSWLQANRIALTDFSTDQHVQDHLPQLSALQAELNTLREASPAEHLNHLAVDLAAIMRRLPSARVKGRR